MTCAEAQDLIEAVAGGVTPGPELASHLADCRGCAGVLAVAVRIERELAGLPAPAAPPGFVQAVTARIRRQRWQQEEHVDRAFNVTMAIGVVIVVVAAVSLFNVASVAQMLLAAVDAVSAIPQESPQWAGPPSLPVTGLTAAVVATTIGIWWWAERRSDLQGE